ncbi:transposase [Paraburkholderia hospita]|uniref:transposase n=1 Tax=Paraburkholderia hospita TaxID=169430 RepID=UPI003134583A
MAGASWHPTSDTPRPMWPPSRPGKKLPDLLLEIDRAWPGQGPIRLMFQDEARFGRISDTRRCWCPKPARPLCRAMVTQEYTYAYAAVSVADGVLDSLILPHVNGACMQMFLDEVCARHPDDRIVMVLDGAGWHQSASLRLNHNLHLLTLPPYSTSSIPSNISGTTCEKSPFTTTSSIASIR